jgi:hypothetical protein
LDAAHLQLAVLLDLDTFSIKLIALYANVAVAIIVLDASEPLHSPWFLWMREPRLHELKQSNCLL